MSPQGDLELLIEREFNAPSQLVFRLWERSDHMLRWWGPEKFTAIEMDWELTPGRAWRGAMTSQEYGLSRFSGVRRSRTCFSIPGRKFFVHSSLAWKKSRLASCWIQISIELSAANTHAVARSRPMRSRGSSLSLFSAT